ncbi:hypothetical protein DFH09DRAFT_1425539 [Mycena vulgaris]|nr:hypothetical protein DFH09DRAFT_1425539 [Mycena vulgaris]
MYEKTKKQVHEVFKTKDAYQRLRCRAQDKDVSKTRRQRPKTLPKDKDTQRRVSKTTIDTPLTKVQSFLLIRTLCDAQMVGRKPHPAFLIQQLGLTDSARRWRPEWKMIEAHIATSPHPLKNLYELTSTNERAGNLAAGVDELGEILGTPAHFPNLRELFVATNGTNTNFNASLDMENYVTSLRKQYRHFPYSVLNFEIPFYNSNLFPSQPYLALIAAIDMIHLPVLATVDLSVNPALDDDFDVDSLPRTDFSAVFASHPNLLDLELAVPGKKLADDISFYLAFTRSRALSKIPPSYWPNTNCEAEYRKILTKLQSLRVQGYRSYPDAKSNWPITRICPPKGYISEFNSWLPFVPQLTCIDISLWADTNEEGWDEYYGNYSGSEAILNDLMWSPPEMSVEYRFSVIRKTCGGHVVLVHTQIL